MDAEAVLVDTNILLTATTPARALHIEALYVLDEWPGKGIPLLVSGQVLREYLVVATRPVDVNGLGLDVEPALANIALFRQRLHLVDERVAVFEHLDRLVREIGCTGKQIHDANLVATALANGAGSILTINVKHFKRFTPYIRIRTLGSTDHDPEE